MRVKISIIGAGHVGATIAQKLVQHEVGKIVLVDNKPGLAEGRALDILHSAPIEDVHASMIGTTDFSKIKGSSIVVITAGFPRKEGMLREDLIDTNAKIVSEVADEIKKYAQNAKIIVVTNPLDLMAYLVYKKLGIDRKNIIGMGGVLDTARYKTIISKQLNLNVSQVHALVMGAHGKGMIPVPECTSVTGIPVKLLLTDEQIEEAVNDTINAGSKIVGLLKTGSACVAPAAAVVKTIKALLFGNRYLSCASAYLDGEYSAKDLFIGVPVVIGEEGMEQIIEVELSDELQKRFNEVAGEIKEGLKIVKKYI